MQVAHRASGIRLEGVFSQKHSAKGGLLSGKPQFSRKARRPIPRGVYAVAESPMEHTEEVCWGA